MLFNAPALLVHSLDNCRWDQTERPRHVSMKHESSASDANTDHMALFGRAVPCRTDEFRHQN